MIGLDNESITVTATAKDLIHFAMDVLDELEKELPHMQVLRHIEDYAKIYNLAHMTPEGNFKKIKRNGAR